METLVANLTGKTRRVTRNGREYIVAPVSMIVPGVLNGSQGPILYTAEENVRSVDAWNGMPLVVYHPRGPDEKPVSARSPEIIDEYGVGEVFNSRAGDKGELLAEAWFEVSSVRRVDTRVMSLLEKSNPFELSTGLDFDKVPVANGSEYEGTSYDLIARNYRPDHLAILPDQKGACSVEDGCGVLVNEMSHDQLRGLLQDKLQTKLGKDSGVWVDEVFDDEIIYQRDSKLFRIGYTKTDADGVQLSGDVPVEVIKVVTFKPTANEENDMSISKADRKKIVDGLITNDCCWEEADREVLNGLTDEKLGLWKDQAEKDEARKLVVNVAQKGFEDKGGNTHTFDLEKNEWESKMKEPEKKEDGAVVNKLEVRPVPAEPQTAEEWMKTAPQAIQNTLRHAQGIEAREKVLLIDRLVTNAADKDAARKMLGDKSLAELQGLLTLVPQETAQPVQTLPSYLGQSVPAHNVQSEFDNDDVLPLPVVNHEKEHEENEARRAQRLA